MSNSVLEALGSVYNPLINDVVEKYDLQLRKNGQYLNPDEKRRLKGQLKEDMIIKLNLSINLTKKKMETWEIFPNSEKQTELKLDYEEGESDEAAEQLKQAVLYEVSGLNQGEGEELEGFLEGLQEDQEGSSPADQEGQVLEEQLLESILEREETPEYEKRKRAYKKREAAAPLQ